MRKILFSVFLSALLIPFSCSSSDDTTYSDSMTGSVEYVLPLYTVPGQELHLHADGILAPTGITWSWYSATLEISDTDTVAGQDLDFTIRDSLGKYSLTAYAKKSGYYTSSSTQYTNVIDNRIQGGESISGILTGDGSITDGRDSEVYYYKKYGRLDWFTLNLRYAGAGSAYQGSDSVATLFGRLYSWDEATAGKTGTGLGGGPRGLCPEGWSIPTEEDWCELANAAKLSTVTDSLVFDDSWSGITPGLSADLYINEVKFWEYWPENLPTNLHRWNAFPAGRSFNNHTSFEQIGSYGFWWAASLSDDSERAFFRYLYVKYPDLSLSSADRSNVGMSVRCVRLAE